MQICTMLIAGYIAALLIGLSLGLIGGGGSILTVPILVYLFGVSPVLATSYSLFIVGVSSLVGSLSNIAAKKVDFTTVVIFGVSSVITVFCIRHYVIPYLPRDVSVGGKNVAVSLITMLLFAVLMIASSFSMIKGASRSDELTVQKGRIFKISIYGLGVGLVTGLLGAGGGFLLMPALIILLRVPVKKAIATSLIIITVNSLVGFADDITHHAIDWNMLLKVTGMSVMGILAGTAIGKRVEGDILKKSFGWFVLFMGVCIIIHELTGVVRP